MRASYPKLLTNPLWQKKRLEVMQRDEFRCRFCGDKTTELHIHHLIYLHGRNPWEYEDDYLLTLCATCHTDEEKLKTEDPMLVGMFSMAGLNRRQLYALATELRRHLDASNKEEKFQDLMEYLANV